MRISDAIPERVAYAQVSEEAVELAHAFDKLTRYVDPEQKDTLAPGITEESLRLQAFEEIADVLLCLEVAFDYPGFKSYFFAQQLIEAGKKGKARRWAERLGIDLDEEEG